MPSLHVAVIGGHEDAVELLLNYGAPVDEVDQVLNELLVCILILRVDLRGAVSSLVFTPEQSYRTRHCCRAQSCSHSRTTAGQRGRVDQLQ